VILCTKRCRRRFRFDGVAAVVDSELAVFVPAAADCYCRTELVV